MELQVADCPAAMPDVKVDASTDAPSKCSLSEDLVQPTPEAAAVPASSRPPGAKRTVALYTGYVGTGYKASKRIGTHKAFKAGHARVSAALTACQLGMCARPDMCQAATLQPEIASCYSLAVARAPRQAPVCADIAWGCLGMLAHFVLDFEWQSMPYRVGHWSVVRLLLLCIHTH